MCMSIFYHKVYELNGDAILKEKSLAMLKKLTEILVIDDKEFSFLEALRKHEFSIQQKNDLTHLSDAAEYDVILCDIRGVGKFLESEYEGANLIKALKTKYPNTYNSLLRIPNTSQGAYDAAWVWCINYERPAGMETSSFLLTLI